MTSKETGASSQAMTGWPVEEIIEPERIICDPHVHIWDKEINTPRSSSGAWDAIGHVPYSLSELSADASSGHKVEKLVFVECGQSYRQCEPEAFMPVGESEFVAASARKSLQTGGPKIAGMVGMADLSCGSALEKVLDAHMEASDGLLRGVRARVANDPERSKWQPLALQPPADLMASDAFRAGVKLLGRRALALDMWIFHPQLRLLAKLVRAADNVNFVIDHLGVPLAVGRFANLQQEMLRSWREDMKALAAFPNVAVKIGGFGMYLFGLGWRDQLPSPTSDEIVAAMADRVHFVIDTFGPSRCMFESNFPVDRRSFSYVTLWNAFKKMSCGYSESEKKSLFHDTADMTYRLSAHAVR